MSRNDNILDSLTLIIPTHEREPLLNDSLKYWSKSGIKNIVVIDSSKKSNIIASEKVKNYLHLPNVSVIEKFNISLKYISTDYVIVCADDDFISLKSIKKCLEFLKINMDYGCAHGHYCDFQYLKKTKKIKWNPKYTYISPSIEQNNPIERLGTHLNFYAPLMYSVMRKNVMESSYRQTLSYKEHLGYDYYPLYEIMISSLQVIKGKVKKFDDLYSIRQYLPNSGGNKSLQFRELYLKEDFSRNYNFYKSLIIKNLSNTNKSNDIISKISEIDFYFNNFYKSRLMTSPNSWYYPSNDTLSSNKNYDIKSSINNNSYLFNLLKRYFYILKSFFLSFRVQKQLNIYVPKWWWLNFIKQTTDIKNITKLFKEIKK
jgi:glycosyltransferase domain-containing protein